MRNARGHQGENERQWGKKHKNTYDISPIKREARNFWENSLHIEVVKNNGK